MATIYSLNDLGRVFNFTLPSSISPADVISQRIIFYKPNGEKFEKTATINSNVVIFENSSPDVTVLDMKGKWEFTAQVAFSDGNILEVPEKSIFWVE